MITGIGAAQGLASGQKAALYNTLEELHQYWDRIDIISPYVKGAESEAVYFDNVHVHCLKTPLFFYPILFIQKILRLHHRAPFDLMTVHEFPPFYNGLAAKIINWQTQVPYILEIHHIPGYPRAANFKEFIYRNLMRLFIRFDAASAQSIRVVNQKETPDFLIYSGVPAEKIKYIPSIYIDLNVFYPKSVNKKFDLVYIGRLEKNKGLVGLIKAIKEIKKTRPQTTLVIGGIGPMKKQLENEVKKLGLDGNVFFQGWLNDSSEVALLMNQSRIFVNPSFNEGGPRVAIEAMACGLLVASTRVGIMNDVIRDGISGIFIDWDYKKMAQKLLEILDDNQKIEIISSESIKIANEFDKVRIINKYASELTEIINKNE